MLVAERRTLSRERMLAYLDKLEDLQGPATSIYFQAGMSTKDVRHMLDSCQGETPDALEDAVCRSGTGAALWWTPRHMILALPPFPMSTMAIFPGYSTVPMRDLLQADRTIGLVLVRLGAYGVAVSAGGAILSSKVGTGLVHARHKKGGSSAQRFARHREKQMEYFFTRICERAREHFEPRIPGLEYVVYGGDRNTILALQKQCDFLRRLPVPVLDRLLNVREPNMEGLRSAIDLAWSTTVTEWKAPEPG